MLTFLLLCSPLQAMLVQLPPYLSRLAYGLTRHTDQGVLVFV